MKKAGTNAEFVVTDTAVFAGLLVVITVILVGLIYFPVLALGPIVEHLAGHF